MNKNRSLAIEYRPTTFNDVVEQKGIVDILQNQIKTKSNRNAYLFTGGAGTGKTTCARIFASELNQGKGNPIEVDAASNSGVDNVREIIDKSKTRALDSEFKVYIIDECHMLSNAAWNAMLKLIEEPPLKTVFVFCTTDPQKIPATILSRVQRYDFKRISYDGIVERLNYILNFERIAMGGEADALDNDDVFGGEYRDVLEYIAKVADGGMRDAITLLDKALSYSSELNQDTIQALGLVDYHKMFELGDALIDQESGEVVSILETLHADGIDLKQFIKQFINFTLDVNKYFIFKGDAEVFKFISTPKTYQKGFELYYDKCEIDFINDMLSTLLNLNNDIKWEQAPKPIIISTLVLLAEGV